MAGGLKRVGSFRELLVYQKSRELALEIFQLTKRFPKEEMYARLIRFGALHVLLAGKLRKLGQSGVMRNISLAS